MSAQPKPKDAEVENMKAAVDRALADPECRKRIKKATDRNKRQGLTGSGARKALDSDA